MKQNPYKALAVMVIACCAVWLTIASLVNLPDHIPDSVVSFAENSEFGRYVLALAIVLYASYKLVPMLLFPNKKLTKASERISEPDILNPVLSKKITYSVLIIIALGIVFLLGGEIKELFFG